MSALDYSLKLGKIVRTQRKIIQKLYLSDFLAKKAHPLLKMDIFLNKEVCALEIWKFMVLHVFSDTLPFH